MIDVLGVSVLRPGVPAKRKDLIARKHYQVKSQLNGNLQMKPQPKGISVSTITETPLPDTFMLMGA